ncbi:MAG: hypothetical protein ACQGVK_14425 [Myxococcota bacterium]
MQRSPLAITTLRTALGTLAVAGALLLAWPGVHVARADSQPQGAEFERFMSFVGESPRAAAPAADTCNAGKGLQAAEAGVSQVMARMKRQAREAEMRAKVEGDRPAVIMLNARGYNYGAAPDAAAQLGQVHQEIARRSPPHS